MSTSKITNGQNSQAPESRVRSPGYPAVSLPAAIEFARMFYDAEHHGFVPRLVAITHFGFMRAGKNKDQISGHANTGRGSTKRIQCRSRRGRSY